MFKWALTNLCNIKKKKSQHSLGLAKLMQTTAQTKNELFWGKPLFFRAISVVFTILGCMWNSDSKICENHSVFLLLLFSPDTCRLRKLKEKIHKEIV